MKKIIIATALLVVLFATAASAAGTFEFQSKNVGMWKHTATVGFGEQISPMFGWTGFVLASTTWSEAYVGPTFKPASWITLAGCAGIQDDPQQSRFAAWVFLTHGKLSGFYVKESGSGDWHKLLISYTADFGKIQLWNQTGLGTGPRVEIKLPVGQKARLSAYAGVMLENSRTNTAVGIIKGF